MEIFGIIKIGEKSNKGENNMDNTNGMNSDNGFTNTLKKETIPRENDGLFSSIATDVDVVPHEDNSNSKDDPLLKIKDDGKKDSEVHSQKENSKKPCHELLKEVKQLVTLIKEDDTKDEFNNKIDSLSNEFKALKDDIYDKYVTTKDIRHLESDIIEQLKKHTNDYSDEINRWQNETQDFVDDAKNGIIKSILGAIKDLDSSYSYQIDDLSNEIQRTNNNISHRKTEIEKLFNEMKGLILEKDTALSELRKELQTVNTKVDNLSNDYQKTIDSLRNELDSRKDEYEKNLKKLEEDKSNLTILKDKEKEDELTSLRNLLEDEKKEEIKGIEKEYKELIINLETDFNKQKAIYEENIRSLKEKTESLKNEMNKDKNEESERNRPFVNLLEKIVNCESMKEFSDNKKLNDIYSSYSNSPEKIRDFISLVGNEYGFALDICNALKKFKKASADPKPITQEEKELIEEINKFYREREGRDQNEELLYLPKGFSYSNVSGAKIPFYEPEMQDLKDAMQNRFEYISDVYTPCFKKYGTMNPQIKATVKGRIKG